MLGTRRVPVRLAVAWVIGLLFALIFILIVKILPKFDSIQSTQQLHWNIASRSPPGFIYVCSEDSGRGNGEIKSILGSALPEYKFAYLDKIVTSWDEPSSNSSDIFIIGAGTTCNNKVIDPWLLYTFKGKILFHSPESPRILPPKLKDAIHYFGPVLDERPEKDFLLTYLQSTWHHRFQSALPVVSMTDPALRPRSNMTHFMIYSQHNCVKIREETAGKLSHIGVLHFSGRCKGRAKDRTNLTKIDYNFWDPDLNRTVTEINIRNWASNVHLNKQYRFCLVMEHTADNAADYPSYITEKILMAFIGGCIPIYTGPELIFDFFNSKAFVFYNVSNPQPSLDQVRELESDAGKYNAMLAEPIVADGDKTIEKYFSFDDNVGGGALKKKMRLILGLSNLVVP